MLLYPLTTSVPYLRRSCDRARSRVMNSIGNLCWRDSIAIAIPVIQTWFGLMQTSRIRCLWVGTSANMFMLSMIFFANLVPLTLD